MWRPKLGGTGMRFRTEVLVWGLVAVCMIKCPSGLIQHCDNGKTKLETDLPPPDEFLCPKQIAVTSALVSSLSSSSALQLLDITTKYSAQPAEHVCMDLPITYNHSIPNSGAHRPVGAQSGEYLYCPPQRWINNLKDGAIVLLFHPCASQDARRSLAAVAHSCLPHFILTAHPQLSQHRPLALVSWGHTLEMSHITTAGVCEWLLTIFSNFHETTMSQSQNYNLYLTKAASVDRVLDTSVKSLKICCVKALSASGVTSRSRKFRSVLQNAKRRLDKEVKHIEKSSPSTSELNTEINATLTQPLNNSESKDSLSISTRGCVAPRLYAALPSDKQAGVGTGVATDAKERLKNPLEKTVVKINDSQTDVKSHKMSGTEAAGKQRVKTDVAEQSPGPVATAVLGGPLRGQKMAIQRSDEAVWAAAALGFLLVLLTLSVLHTRLYRNCRPPSSLYWSNSQQDYESVADIIRRRLRMVGRRKRRASYSRRQECPLLFDSSTDDD